MKYLIILIIIIGSIFAFISYNSTTSVGTQVEIVSKDQEKGEYWIIVKEINKKENKKIIVPPVVWSIINIEQEYFISYEFNKWRVPFLTRIQH